MTLENGSGGQEGQNAGGADPAGGKETSLLGGDNSGSAPPSGAPPSNTDASKKPAGPNDWRAAFSQGLDDDTAKTWNGTVQKYESPQALAKAHVSLLKEMNNRVVIPGPDAKDDDFVKVYDKLGRPQDPKEYKFDEPDYAPLTDSEKETRESFRSVAHRAGLNQKQLKMLQDWQYEQRKVAYDAETVAPKVFAERSVGALKKEWNVDFDRNVELAKFGAKEVGGTEWSKIANLRLADGGLLGDHPDMVKIWTRVGSQMAEDDRRPVYRADQAQGIQEQIDTITREAVAAGKLPSSPEYHKRLQPLYDKLYGKKPINLGSRG